jgi:hypothetical protein
MSQLSDNLVRVIDHWSHLETGGFDSSLSLSGLWDESHLDTIPFDPDGIDDLIHTIKSDQFFNSQPRAQLLEHGQFSDGGGIQTEGDLHDFLEENS